MYEYNWSHHIFIFLSLRLFFFSTKWTKYKVEVNLLYIFCWFIAIWIDWLIMIKFWTSVCQRIKWGWPRKSLATSATPIFIHFKSQLLWFHVYIFSMNHDLLVILFHSSYCSFYVYDVFKMKWTLEIKHYLILSYLKFIKKAYISSHKEITIA